MSRNWVSIFELADFTTHCTDKHFVYFQSFYVKTYNMEGSDIHNNAILIETIWKAITAIDAKKEKKEERMELEDESTRTSRLSDDPVSQLYLCNSIVYP